MQLIIVYDIPKSRNTLLVRIWRELRKIGAEKISGSVWSLEDNEINLEILKGIKNLVSQGGGNAKIMRVVEIE